MASMKTTRARCEVGVADAKQTIDVGCWERENWHPI